MNIRTLGITLAVAFSLAPSLAGQACYQDSVYSTLGTTRTAKVSPDGTWVASLSGSPNPGLSWQIDVRRRDGTGQSVRVVTFSDPIVNYQGEEKTWMTWRHKSGKSTLLYLWNNVTGWKLSEYDPVTTLSAQLGTLSGVSSTRYQLQEQPGKDRFGMVVDDVDVLVYGPRKARLYLVDLSGAPSISLTNSGYAGGFRALDIDPSEGYLLYTKQTYVLVGSWVSLGSEILRAPFSGSTLGTPRTISPRSTAQDYTRNGAFGDDEKTMVANEFNGVVTHYDATSPNSVTSFPLNDGVQNFRSVYAQPAPLVGLGSKKWLALSGHDGVTGNSPYFFPYFSLIPFEGGGELIFRRPNNYQPDVDASTSGDGAWQTGLWISSDYMVVDAYTQIRITPRAQLNTTLTVEHPYRVNDKVSLFLDPVYSSGVTIPGYCWTVFMTATAQPLYQNQTPAGAGIYTTQHVVPNDATLKGVVVYLQATNESLAGGPVIPSPHIRLKIF